MDCATTLDRMFLDIERICNRMVATQQQHRKVLLGLSNLRTHDGFAYGPRQRDGRYFQALDDTIVATQRRRLYRLHLKRWPIPIAGLNNIVCTGHRRPDLILPPSPVPHYVGLSRVRSMIAGCNRYE